MKLKKKSVSFYKKKLDKVFSIYIRQKGADSSGMNTCYTCGVRKHWKELQCGHWISRSYLATRFIEENCRPQCMQCNVFKDGCKDVFSLKLLKELGEKRLQELQRMKQVIVKNYPYESEIKFYESSIK